jgi:N-acetylglucosaminyldiphosphoundecaprenol N-acetyl-beta-D-mannosaminyltransferase
MPRPRTSGAGRSPRSATAPRTYTACGVPITALSPAGAAETIVARARTRTPLQVHLCNAYTLSLVDQDRELEHAVRSADLNLPDGVPVAWLGRRCGVRGPVRGPGLVRDVMRLGVRSGVRHYLYGGAPGVAEQMRTRLEDAVPGVEIVGSESPPYQKPTPAQLDQLADRVRETSANLVWIGLGTPRQDYVVPQLADRVRCPVVPVGAAFDYLAGTAKEAPAVLQGRGLEWAHRLSTEPGRLWRRYLLGNPRFVLSALRHARGPLTVGAGSGSSRTAAR